MSNQFEDDLGNLDKRIADRQKPTQKDKQAAEDWKLLKEKRKELISTTQQLANEHLTPILEKAKAWLEKKDSIGSIDIISNSRNDSNPHAPIHPSLPFKDNWSYAATVRLTWDTGIDNNGNRWGNGIQITLGNDHNLAVSRADHTNSFGPYAPKNFTLEDVKERLDARLPGTGPLLSDLNLESGMREFADKLNYKHPNLGDEDWQERIQSDIIKILENGQEKYSYNIHSLGPGGDGTWDG